MSTVSLTPSGSAASASQLASPPIDPSQPNIDHPHRPHHPDDIARKTQAEILAGGSNGVYDPNQAKEQRRRVRKKLRNFEEKAGLMKNDPTGVSAETFDSQIGVLDDNFRASVRAPAEATLDSRALRLLSETALKKSRSLRTELNAFDTDEFIQRFVEGYGQKSSIGREEPTIDMDHEFQPIDWHKVGRTLMRFSRRVPTMDMMYGPLEIPPKKRMPSQRNKVEKDQRTLRAPEQLKESDLARSENEISTLIKRIHEILVDQGGPDGINLFKFFINPMSFGQSVENLFCLSFLIRDGKVAIDLQDEAGVFLDYPVVFASEPASATDHQAGHKKTQAIIQFEMKDWEDAIDVFSIEAPIIPHRDESAGGLNSKKKWP